MPNALGKAWLATFDATLIINMKAREDRRRQSIQELRKLGLEVDGERIAFFPAIEPADPAPFKTRGEKGCFLSHTTIMERLCDAAGNRFVVLEDDFCFTWHFLRRGEQLLAEMIDGGWDLAQLGPLDYETAMRFREVPFWSQRKDWGFGTHCYAVSKDALRTIAYSLREHVDQAEGVLPLDLFFDGLVSRLEASRFLRVRRPIAFQRPSPSDIRGGKQMTRLPHWMRVAAENAKTEFMRAKLL